MGTSADSGVSMNVVLSDFDAVAAQMLSPDAAPEHWDVIAGQGSLSTALLSMLYSGSQPDVIIVCHIRTCRSETQRLGGPAADPVRCNGLSRMELGLFPVNVAPRRRAHLVWCVGIGRGEQSRRCRVVRARSGGDLCVVDGARVDPGDEYGVWARADLWARCVAACGARGGRGVLRVHSRRDRCGCDLSDRKKNRLISVLRLLRCKQVCLQRFQQLVSNAAHVRIGRELARG